MTAPLFIALWRCACGSLDIVADHQWSEARALALSQGVEVDHALDPIPEVPKEENFISHKYLQACLFDEHGETVAPMVGFVDQCGEGWTESLASLDAAKATRLRPVLLGIRKTGPEYLAGGNTLESTAETLLRLTESLDIQWRELEEAARLPHAQMPPMGSTPPTDDYTPPLTTSVSMERLLKLVKVTTLRTHAAMALKKTDAAMAGLRIQIRLAQAHFDHGTFVNMIVGSSLVQGAIDQVYAGFRLGGWRDADIRWFAEWAASMDFAALLKQACGMECVYGIRYVESLKADHGFEDRMVRSLLKEPWMAELFPEIGLPFDQSWLAPLRGNSEILYRLAPEGVFTLGKAAGLRTFCEDYLALVVKGGLREFAWPEKDNRKVGPVISYSKIGEGLAAQQSRINLLRTACALHQWHRAHGAYPKTLEEMRPELPDAAFEDVCSGRPLRYVRSSDDTYRLHAVGPDRVDDKRKPMVDGKGDIVWN